MYTAVLPKLGHPRHLSLVQREQVVKDGLGDREPGVRVAAGKLLAKWFDVILSEADKQPESEDTSWEGDDSGTMKGLIRFLSLFDVIGSGEAIAVDTLISIFVTRPDIPEVFVFPGERNLLLRLLGSSLLSLIRTVLAEPYARICCPGASVCGALYQEQ